MAKLKVTALTSMPKVGGKKAALKKAGNVLQGAGKALSSAAPSMPSMAPKLAAPKRKAAY